MTDAEATSKMRIICKSTEGQSYAIGVGNPKEDPMMPVLICDLDEGVMHTPTVPLQQIFKFGNWKDPVEENDRKLIARLMELPEAATVD